MRPNSENPSQTKQNDNRSGIFPLRILLLLTIAEGLCAVLLTFLNPSEPKTTLYFGYSAARLILGGITLALVCVLIAGCVYLYRNPSRRQKFAEKLDHFFRQGDRLFFSLLFFAAGVLLSAWCLVFSWLFIPANLRPQILWAMLFFAQSLLLLRHTYQRELRAGNYLRKYRLLPRLKDLSLKQRRILLCLAILSILYILLLLPANINGTQDWAAFQHYGGGEYVIYPILMDVMRDGETFSATLYHRFIYEDYHYGYPFYAWSALVLTPVKILTGEAFPDQIQINLPLLRILVSVLPVILACLIIVWLFTRFQHWLLSPAVFLFLLFAPGTLQNNQGFWHPDGLNLLFVCLVLYFLQRDRLRFGRNFYLAAVFTGLSAAIRLYGFFFVLAIAVYLLIGLLKKTLTVPLALRRGLIYTLLMAAVIVLANPFLFRADARGRMIEIMQEKSGEMAEGYAGDYDPRNDYRPGWDAWYPAFEDHYTEMFCFFFLIASMIFACFYGEQRLTHLLTLCWFVMIGGYLIFFVAVKSTQYVLPMLLPLMGTGFSLPLALSSGKTPAWMRNKVIHKGAWLLSTGIFLAQLLINLDKIRPRF